MASESAQRPITKPSSDTSNMSGSSCPERWAITTGTQHCHGDRPQRDLRYVGPGRKGADRDSGKDEVRGRGRVGDTRDDRDHEREHRDNRTHVRGQGRLRTRLLEHASTILRRAVLDIALEAEWASDQGRPTRRMHALRARKVFGTRAH